MAEKDIAQKTFMALDDVFADIFNVLVFRGKEVLVEKNLEEKVGVDQYKALDGRLHEQERDVLKQWKWKGHSVNLLLAGIENQTKPDRSMPLRVIGYDGAAYRSQLLNGKNTKKSRRRVKYSPVVTIILYFGKEQWNYPKSLKESFCPVLPEDEIGQILKEYIQDYKIHIFDIPRLPQEIVAKFKSDFKMVAEYFTNVYTNPGYMPTAGKIRHIDEFLKLMRVLTGDDRYEKMEFSEEEKGEGIDMCAVLDYRERQVTEKVTEKERLNGIQNIMKNLGYTAEQAMKVLEIPVKERKKYSSLLQEV